MKREKYRWQYRFANFSRAYALLQEVNDLNSENKLDQLGKEGMIRRFKYSVDLAWNVKFNVNGRRRRSNSRLKSHHAIGDAMREVEEAIEARRKQIYGVAVVFLA